jgi:L-fuconolactonase
MTDYIIDSHQHVWDPSRARYDWLTSDLAPIDRAIGFDELEPSLRRAGVDATVLVQSADNAEDTELMFETAAAHPQIVGVVGYVPLDRPAEASSALTALRRHPLFVGVRNLAHTRPDPDWLITPEVDEGLGLLEAAGVPFDMVGVLPRHLELVPIISQRHPGLTIVIDHLNKPPIGQDSREPWWHLIAAAAENPRVYGKVSGLYPLDAPTDWTADTVRPFVDRAIEVFGIHRLMYGGDWPISVLSGGYDHVWDELSVIFADLNPTDRARILGGTAAEFYGIPMDRLATATLESE